MLLKDNKSFKLPGLQAGSFSGLDRLNIPYNILILRQVFQRPDNGNIELICKAQDGPEEKRGGLRFLVDDRSKKDALYGWLKQQIGKDIETIHNSDFSFEEDSMKKCPKCGSKMFESWEPKVATLANINSKFPNQIKFWRCSNNDCAYKENYEI